MLQVLVEMRFRQHRQHQAVPLQPAQLAALPHQLHMWHLLQQVQHLLLLVASPQQGALQKQMMGRHALCAVALAAEKLARNSASRLSQPARFGVTLHCPGRLLVLMVVHHILIALNYFSIAVA